MVLTTLVLTLLASPATAQRAKQRVDRSQEARVEKAAEKVEEPNPDEIRGRNDQLLNPPVEPRADEPLPKDFRAILEERERERMHPALEPLTISGIDENGAAFRTSTPSLARALIQPLEVDGDDLYERKLALFSGGGRSFDRAPTTIAPTGPPRTTQAAPKPTRNTGDASNDEGGSNWAIIALLSSVAALIAVRRRGL
ncbi:hypothetical protein Pla163_24340 [Planctomycetes bacterium Pla163]|uniref:Uncharacterized protein n=1 Tax=Rohdeia mirabilis TaxID=2528008 RepID=A0A518D1F1_9BACT|nr:hypothetical protein Pla163_24340 [Planctomycetes bacterium Pla163]